MQVKQIDDFTYVACEKSTLARTILLQVRLKRGGCTENGTSSWPFAFARGAQGEPREPVLYLAN